MSAVGCLGGLLLLSLGLSPEHLVTESTHYERQEIKSALFGQLNRTYSVKGAA